MLRSSLSRNAGGHGGNAGEETYDMGVHIFVPKHLVPWTSLDPLSDLIRSPHLSSFPLGARRARLTALSIKLG